MSGKYAWSALGIIFGLCSFFGDPAYEHTNLILAFISLGVSAILYKIEEINK